jgi:acetyl-CoA synthetase
MAIGVPDRLKGQSIVAYVIVKKEYEKCARNREGINKLRREIIQCIEDGIGKFASPKEIKLVYDLPRTPTGKTVRKLIVKKENLNNKNFHDGYTAPHDNLNEIL